MKGYLYFLISSLFVITSLAYSNPILANMKEDKVYLEQLKNTVYYLSDGQIISLLDGRSQYQGLSFLLQETIAVGDLNGDTIQDAVGVLTTLRQGVQVGNYLAFFIANREGKLKNIDTFNLEDKIKLETINIQSQELTLNFFAYLARDFPCCPSQKKQLKYSFDPLSKTLIPLAMKSEKQPQDSWRINRRFRDIEENNELQIKF